MGRSDHGRMADPLSSTPDGGAPRVPSVASPPGDAPVRQGMARGSGSTRRRDRGGRSQNRPTSPAPEGPRADAVNGAPVARGVSANGRPRGDARAAGAGVRRSRDFKRRADPVLVAAFGDLGQRLREGTLDPASEGFWKAVTQICLERASECLAAQTPNDYVRQLAAASEALRRARITERKYGGRRHHRQTSEIPGLRGPPPQGLRKTPGAGPL